MKIAPLPRDEQERISELKSYGILDTEPEKVFEDMVKLANYLCQTSISAISLVDEQRQWFKAIAGLDAKETSRDIAFCAHAILQQETMIVPDALLDERFHDNPLVTHGPNIRFYAGVPLKTPGGRHLGTLCVIDREPRKLTPTQLSALETLANSVMAHLDLRQSHKEIRRYVDGLQLAAQIFESVTEAMIVTDPDNNILTVNPAFTSTTGYTREEVVGKNPNILSSGKQGPAFYQAMWHTLNSEGHWSGELWNKRKDGQLYLGWLSIRALFNEDGSKRLHLAIYSDISHKKLAEELLRTQVGLMH